MNHGILLIDDELYTLHKKRTVMVMAGETTTSPSSPTTLSNQQPLPDVPGQPRVTAFLKSEQTTMNLKFRTIGIVEEFTKRFGQGYSGEEHNSATAHAVKASDKMSAYIRITKSAPELFRAQQTRYCKSQDWVEFEQCYTIYFCQNIFYQEKLTLLSLAVLPN